jgi:hypothetical protein
VVDVWITDNQQTVLICWIMMTVPEFLVLLWKFLLCSEEFGIYLSRKLQALSGNEEAISLYIPAARDKDADAIEVLRKVAGEHAGARAALAMLGYTAIVETAGWAPEVLKLHEEHQAAQDALHTALVEFRMAFRGLCERRDGVPPTALTRNHLTAEAERLWRENVHDKIVVLGNVDGRFVLKGIPVRRWSADFEEEDPRRGRRLWKLDDNDLIELFGWSTPAYERYLATQAHA